MARTKHSLRPKKSIFLGLWRVFGLILHTSFMFFALKLEQTWTRIRQATPATLEHKRSLWIKRWSGGILKFLSIDIAACDEGKTKNSDEVANMAYAPKGILWIANHRSALDILFMFSLSGGYMISRHDLADWPLIGFLARQTETLFVDRKDNRSGLIAIRQMTRYLEKGRQVVVFPEGTTFDGDEVHPFFIGCFAAALQAGARIQPIGLAYERGSHVAYGELSFGRHMLQLLMTARLRVGLAFGATLSAEGSAAELAKRAEVSVGKLVQMAREEVDKKT